MISKACGFPELNELIRTDDRPILFITTADEDYLTCSLLHGLRSVLGVDVIDYPRCDFLDNDLPVHVRQRSHGKGFTLCGTRPREEGDAVDRTHAWVRLRANQFAKVIFSSIWRQYGTFIQLREILTPENTVLIDGEDATNIFPYSTAMLRRWEAVSMLTLYKTFPYFKRELCPASLRSTWLNTVPASIAASGGLPATVKPIAFSIPEERIASGISAKDREFFPHCVDSEVARLLPGLSSEPRYATESRYYKALASSRFAITTKRSGWDCMRHYEIAASGCVPCFRNLSAKHPWCAPHGLSSENSVEYGTAKELVDVTCQMSTVEYEARSQMALTWARRNSTRARAVEFLMSIGYLSQSS